MSMQPNPYGQMDYNALGPILALAANRKGGGNAGDLSNILNPIMGIFSNSYTETPQMSEEDIMKIYAPEMSKIAQSGDPILQGILGDIQAGTPVLKIKDAIRKGALVNGTITFTTPDDLSLYDSLVDTLSNEQKKVDEQKYKVATAPDFWSEHNMRNPKEDFDPKQMFPELFSPMADKLKTAQTGVDKRVSEISKKLPGERMAQTEKEKIDFMKNQILSEWRTAERPTKSSSGTPWQDQMNAIDPESMAPRTFSQLLNNTGYAVEHSPVSSVLGIAPLIGGALGMFGRTAKEAVFGEGDNKKNMDKAAEKAAKRYLKENPNKNFTIVDPMEKARAQYQKELAGAPVTAHKVGIGQSGVMNPWTGLATDTSKAVQGNVSQIPVENLRDPVLQQQKLIDMVTQKVQAGLRARGETPSNLDMLNRIILQKTMGM